MRRRHSRRYRWLPMMLTAGGLALILLGGVVATPGRTPDTAPAGDVGLVVDNTSATVVPNADFLRARAQALEILDATVSQLRSSTSASAVATADRLGAIAARLSATAPSQPEELEAIVAQLKRERATKLVRRLKVTISDSDSDSVLRPADATHDERIEPIRDVVGVLGNIIDVLAELIRRLFPIPPYAPPYHSRPHR